MSLEPQAASLEFENPASFAMLSTSLELMEVVPPFLKPPVKSLAEVLLWGTHASVFFMTLRVEFPL